METIFRYRSTDYTAAEITALQAFIDENPGDNRNRLSRKLCEARGWRQPNGALRDMVARGLLLALHRNGHIRLPEPTRTPHNPLLRREKPEAIPLDQTPIEAKLSEISPLVVRQVRRTVHEKLFNSLIEHFHYLGYTQPVGEHLKYVVFLDERPVACFAWSSAPRHIGCRDRLIGWDQETRRRNIHLMACNTRFLILPWVRIPHLASHLLGKMVRRLSSDWRALYSHPIHFAETFVDTERFAGTCYKAANWTYLGPTTGRGKNDHTNKQNRSLKAVYGYPLARDFREKLCR